jgi:hypothetical membrane protein
MTMLATVNPDRPPRRPNRLLLSGLVVGPLFTLAFLLQQAVRPGYDPLRHPVSSLALGPLGWLQTLNFLVAGLLTITFAVGLRRSLRPGAGAFAAPMLVGVWGVGLVGAGAFVTDPVSGYPVGTPSQPDPPSWHGLLHDLAFSLPGFFSLAAAMFALGYAFVRRRAYGWASYSVLSGIAFVVLFLLASAGFDQDARWMPTAGLWQRLAVGAGWLWLAMLALRQTLAQRRP